MFKNGESGFAGRHHSLDAKSRIGEASRRSRPDVSFMLREGKVGRPFKIGESPPHKGRWRYPAICAICGETFKSVKDGGYATCGKKECVIAYRPIKNAKIANAQQLPEVIAARVAAAKRMASAFPSSYEKILYDWLRYSGLEFEIQKPFPPYVVDAYVPSINVVYEADGYWHDKEYDDFRDAKLMNMGVAAIVRFEHDGIEMLKREIYADVVD